MSLNITHKNISEKMSNVTQAGAQCLYFSSAGITCVWPPLTMSFMIQPPSLSFCVGVCGSMFAPVCTCAQRAMTDFGRSQTEVTLLLIMVLCVHLHKCAG